MKKAYIFALTVIVSLCLFTGCRRKTPVDTSMPTTVPPTTQATQPTVLPTQPTTQATQPSTDMTGPDMEEMIPGTEDTIDPTNGANQDARSRNHTNPRY